MPRPECFRSRFIVPMTEQISCRGLKFQPRPDSVLLSSYVIAKLGPVAQATEARGPLMDATNSST